MCLVDTCWWYHSGGGAILYVCGGRRSEKGVREWSMHHLLYAEMGREEDMASAASVV